MTASIPKRLSKIKTKEVYPNVYAVVINYDTIGFVSLLVAFTDIEARGQALDMFFLNHKQVDKNHLTHPFQFTIAQMSAEELARQVTAYPEKEEEVIYETKSDLMAAIIVHKDVELFEKNKKKFTKNERDFIVDRLK